MHSEGVAAAVTNEEKLQQMTERNAAICAYYQAGHKVSQCASQFRLGRMRVIQVLQKAGVWRPYVKNARTEFLGVSVSEVDKLALRVEAERRGLSMSALTADLIRKMLATVQP